MIFRATLCLTSWLLLAQPSAAQSMRLNPLSGSATVRQEVAQNITGSCGGAVVRILGVERSNSDTYSVDLDSGAVIVRNTTPEGYRELTFTTQNFLSDHNGIACLSGSAGVRLLLWNTCGGSICPDSYVFKVIDPIRVRDLTPEGDCDEQCAARLTGDELPIRLNSRN